MWKVAQNVFWTTFFDSAVLDSNIPAQSNGIITYFAAVLQIGGRL